MLQPAVVMALVALLLASPVAEASFSLCHSEEKIVFACTVGTKLVSLCEEPAVKGGAVSLQYRIGRAGSTPEMRYPTRVDDTPAFRAGSTALAGGGGAWVEFDRSHYRYVIFSFWMRGKGEVAGVAVEAGGTRRATLRCRGAVTSELGPDYFTTAGLAPSSGEFLP